VFWANLAKNTFQRFKCGAAGNHLDLWAGVSRKSLYAAGRLIGQPLWQERTAARSEALLTCLPVQCLSP
jgi:hypothetical protein